MTEIANPDPLAVQLRALTPARVGLGRTGVSQQTRDVLDFQLSHAQARDAVHSRLQATALASHLSSTMGDFGHSNVEVLCLHSQAKDRTTYLQRPDLGRMLDRSSRASLDLMNSEHDLALVVADGLSALAVERHVPPLLKELIPRLHDWRLAPLCIVEQGRVAIADEIGAALGAQISVILIGERPGLSSPDSLGAYITWAPQPGRTDAERNCISNIRVGGLSSVQAADQLNFYLTESRRRKLTGVALKQESHFLKEG
jgi:ethanolamine ammonia-lyase small subunit